MLERRKGGESWAAAREQAYGQMKKTFNPWKEIFNRIKHWNSSPEADMDTLRHVISILYRTRTQWDAMKACPTTETVLIADNRTATLRDSEVLL